MYLDDPCQWTRTRSYPTAMHDLNDIINILYYYYMMYIIYEISNRAVKHYLYKNFKNLYHTNQNILSTNIHIVR